MLSDLDTTIMSESKRTPKGESYRGLPPPLFTEVPWKISESRNSLSSLSQPKFRIPNDLYNFSQRPPYFDVLKFRRHFS